MRGRRQKKEAVARLKTLYWQRQLPELQKKKFGPFQPSKYVSEPVSEILFQNSCFRTPVSEHLF
jgi:hypothetical protein